MQLFYNPEINEETSHFSFSREESKHIVKVLRKKEGDLLQITNGKGWCFKAEIVLADIKQCTSNIISKVFQSKKDYQIHLAVAPTKMNDRYEWFLEKATEIGIDTITPIICDHSERKIIKEERFQKVLQSAMKQSLQYYLPELKPLMTFKDFLNQDFNGQTFIAHCEDSKRFSLKETLQPNQNVIMLIGPEGDFSKSEIDLALSKGFKPVTLGNTRLRTETAAIAAVHSIVFINQ